MRNLTFGGIGLLWGGNILLTTFIQLLSGKLITGTNPYYVAGELTGVLFGFLLCGAGFYYFVKGWKEKYGSGSQSAAGR